MRYNTVYFIKKLLSKSLDISPVKMHMISKLTLSTTEDLAAKFVYILMIQVSFCSETY